MPKTVEVTPELEAKDPFYGAIADESSEEDYYFAGEALKLPAPRKTFWDNEIQYHQPHVSPVSCTIFAALGCVSDLIGNVWPLSDQQEAWDRALKGGANPKVGWYVHLAVDVVRKLANERLSEKLLSFKVMLDEQGFWDALDKGYSVQTGFRGNKDYNSDHIDGYLDGTSFGKTTYGHSVRIVKDKDGDVYNVVVDNYIDSKKERNIYRFKRANLDALIKNYVFFRAGYIFVVKDDFEAHNEEQDYPLWAVEAIKWAKENGYAKKWSKEDMEVKWGDAQLEQYLINRGFLTKKVGHVSKLRYIVAEHRRWLENKNK